MKNKHFEKNEICLIFKAMMVDEYKSEERDMAFNLWLADKWGCSPCRTSNITRGHEAPNKEMLDYMGYCKVTKTWFERV